MNMLDIISQNLNKLNCTYWIINDPSEKNIDFINSIFEIEPFPIFEYNWYEIIGYQTYKGPFWAVILEDNSQLLLQFRNKENKLILFLPLVKSIKGWEIIKKLHEILSISEISILNVSQHWKDIYEKNITTYFGVNNIKEEFRAEEEAVYDLKALNTLNGHKYGTLRNVKNRLLSSRLLTFKKVNLDNLKDAVNILDKWYETQGKKYKGPSRKEKELFGLKNFLIYSKDNENMFVEVGYFNNLPVCLLMYFVFPTHNKWGVNFVLKGLNNNVENNSVNGVSDAAYIHMFENLYSRGVEFLNDGELGYEIGTRTHKIVKFRPINYLQSFNIHIKL